MNRSRIAAFALLAWVVGCERAATPFTPEGGLDAPTSEATIASFVSAAGAAVPNRYIIGLKPGVSVNSAPVRQMIVDNGGTFVYTYEKALRGFAVEIPASAVERLRRYRDIEFVAEDALVRLSDVTQNGATWGLDRIDQRELPLSTSYTYGPTGAGVRVYVVDSGINLSHDDFGGTATIGLDLTTGTGTDDCTGHGSHVAGTIGGTEFGVAKDVSLIGVRVFGCTTSAPTSTLVAGIDWITDNGIQPAVVNLSLGGGINPTLDAAVQASMLEGFIYVIAAGNDGLNACNFSPARVSAALTVGASTEFDTRATFSNWGTCVDIFAPGEGIESAGIDDDQAVEVMDGTSMAAPHAAGVAALYLEDDPTATQAEVNAAIIGAGTVNELVGLNTGSPNLLLYSPLTAAPSLMSVNPSVVDVIFAHSDQVGGSSVPKKLNFTAGGVGSPKVRTAAEPGIVHVASMSPTTTTQVLVANLGGGTVEWEAVSSQPWITVSPADGSLSAGASSFTGVAIDSDGLDDGTYSEDVTFTDLDVPGSPTTVPVTVRVVTPTPLAFGDPETGLSGAADSEAFFVVEVPAGITQLQISTNGGAGDADLYVAAARVPTLFDFDCSPFLFGNAETCTFSFPPAGDLYVMIQGFQAFSGLTLSAVVSGPPAAPSAFVGSHPTSMTAIALSWTDNSSNEDDFQLQRGEFVSAVWSAYADVINPAANATSYNNTGLVSGRPYRYRLRSCNTAGCSAWALTGTVAVPTVPSAPTGAIGEKTGPTSILVEWNDVSTQETGFEIQRRIDDGAFAFLTNVGPGVEDFSDTGLTQGTYRYRVRALGVAGNSAFANTPNILLTAPAAPTGVGAVIVSATSIKITWTDQATNEDDFEIERRVRNPDGPWSQVGVVTGTQFQNTGLTQNTEYEYRVRARNNVGSSAFATSPVVLFAKPAAATSFTGSPTGPTAINLTWTDVATNETSYVLARRVGNGSYVTIATLAAGTTNYGDSGLTTGTQYQYRLRATNLIGFNQTISATIVTP